MTGWWQAKFGSLYCGVVVLTAISAHLLWPTRLYLPNIVAGGNNSFSLAYALSFLPGLTWIVIMESRSFIPEAVSVRRTRLIVLELVTALVPVSVMMLVFLQVGLPTLQGAGRNLVLAVSLSIIGLEIAPVYTAFLLPVGYLLTSGVAGFAFLSSVPHDWALVLSRWDPDRDWLVLLIVVGLAVALRSARELLPWRKLLRSGAT